MKNIFKYLTSFMFLGLLLTGCSPETFDGANANGIPSISDADYTVAVNQSTNNVTFQLNNKGCYPIWNIQGPPDVKTTVNGYEKKYILAGTYNYTLQLGNKNGFSDGVVKGTFKVDSTRYDFAPTLANLTAGGTKEWRVSSKDAAHLACGDSGTDGTGWWKATPDEKSANGVYDDRITFDNSNAYTYSAGVDGKTFCNHGVTSFGISSSSDYDVVATTFPDINTNAKYALGYDDAAGMVTITLPAKTLFPYMADQKMMTGPETFKIASLTSKKMTLIYDVPGTIAWQIILINGADEAVETSFDPDKINWCDVNSDLNLGKSSNTAGKMTFFWSDNDAWTQTADPGFAYADGVYTITVPYATNAEWKGQCSIKEIPISIVKDANYDYSFKINASQDIQRMTFKVNKDPDVKDDPTTAFYNGTISLKKGDNLVRFAKRTSKFDFDQGKMVFDFGGAPANAVLKISNIIIQKHNPK